MRERKSEQVTAMPTNRQMVLQYFNLITRRDVGGLLDLFTEDATVYEPFSNLLDGLHGRSEMEHFFKIVVMANTGMNRKNIEFVAEKGSENDDRITAFVTYERGDTIKSRLDFHFTTLGNLGKRIKTLKILFP
jgi:ketosteroid isomerase-like protein